MPAAASTLQSLLETLLAAGFAVVEFARFDGMVLGRDPCGKLVVVELCRGACPLLAPVTLLLSLTST